MNTLYIKHRIKDAKLWLKREPKFYIQRARRGYSTGDTWSFDVYLASVIAGGTKELADRMMGHPTELTPEQWKSILLEISKGFESYANKFDIDPDWVEFDQVFRLFREWFPHLWD